MVLTRRGQPYLPGRTGLVVGTVILATFSVTSCQPIGTPGTSSSAATPATSGSPTVVQTKQLPDERGKGLKDAVDAVQAAGFTRYSAHDASGRMRVPVLYTDWKVCLQTPPPGTHPISTRVEIGVVKQAESCPATDQGQVTATAGAVMPDLRGRSVRYTHDVLGLTARISYKTLTGATAYVLADSEWQACAQTPAPGQPYNRVPVTLVVAKYSDGGCPQSK
jgi:hypothetical protein